MRLNNFPAILALSLVFTQALSLPGIAQQGQMPPTAVLVQELVASPQPIINELPGRIAATRVSEVRPRVNGILVERVFRQGSFVNAGDVLYRIDPRPFQVGVQAAEASLARARATLANAEVSMNRVAALRQRNVSAQAELDSAETLVAQARADVAAAEASWTQAALNLEYTEIKAPISGVIGRALVTEGALVSSTGEHLALIQQLDPVYADVTQSTTEVFRLRRALLEGKLDVATDGAAKVRLYFDDGSEYPHLGTLLFSEAAVDQSTGQLTLRGEFPNPDGELLPGLYVRVRIEQAIRQNAIVIPQQAVLRDSTGKASVYVVGADGKAEAREVELGATIGSGWMVDRGLSPGDKLIIEGAQKLSPGADIAPEMAPNGNAAAPDPAAAAAPSPETSPQ